MNDWQIKKPHGHCCGSDQPIQPGTEFFAALVETDEGLERRDFSLEYWEKEKPAVFCFWKSRLPLDNEKKSIFIDDEMLMAFFNRLAEETEPEKINFRFVLALVMMRKKRLKYNTTKIDAGREIWQLKVACEKTIVDVVNPNLDEEQIKQLSEQIGQILQVDFING